ncbi:di-heme-cytochrome C peroxidase [uncultured Rhodoblastus sp.]|uniref:di-heme-cytochrome C peroxidase n=1 Tax=uncultured Rhodoblastus sp. TaxID=543037 RepID=UPI0025D4BCD1|nr:di-heme-cytochrome C peroxidase [uncultured Rhodoblastus sp.]
MIEFPEKARPLLPASVAVLLPPPLPASNPPKTVRWLDQNWSEADRFWSHHASQGTATLPISYDWFLALEQPGLSLIAAPGLLSDGAYLARIGFISSPRTLDAGKEELISFGYGQAGVSHPVAPTTSLHWAPADNRDGLPVGFARTKVPFDPRNGQPLPDRIGLTCAACHTGHIEYRGVSLRFDGGPAMVNFNALERAVSLSLFYTLKAPGRFERFSDRVLGAQATSEQREDLRATLQKTFDSIVVAARDAYAREAATGQEHTPENFGRLDALNRIGNRLFYEDLGGGAALAPNFHATDAPVRFPALWSAPWFALAEYDSSIEQPLVRNVGEALGVGSLIDLGGGADGKTLFTSTVALENIVWIEDLYRGGDFFSPGSGGLRAPKWPAALFPDDPAWKIDPARVEKGRALYAELCAGCHLGPIDDPAFDKAFPDKALRHSDAWMKNGTLKLPQIPVSEVGTDPAQSQVLRSRRIEAPPRFRLNPRRDLGDAWNCGTSLPDVSEKSLPFGLALMATVDRIARKSMEDRGLTEDDRKAVFGPRANCPNAEPQAVYRARPLDGVWAMAPFLHNGSVPSLYWLLRPAGERPRKFCLGARDYDPRRVGYPADPVCAPGETLFEETDSAGRSLKGNSAAGHSFEGDGASRPGVVGRALGDDERDALIDYLKTL